MKPTDINWVARNPRFGAKRLQWEMEQLSKHFPQFSMMCNGSEMWVEGQLVTRSQNLYNIRAYYPETYPYDRIISCVMDPDIVKFCREKGGHQAHNFGEHHCGGIQLCIFGPGDWIPDYSVITILQTTSVWLHVIEVKKETDVWVWPEA